MLSMEQDPSSDSKSRWRSQEIPLLLRNLEDYFCICMTLPLTLIAIQTNQLPGNMFYVCMFISVL
jgi:hypothetical protein